MNRESEEELNPESSTKSNESNEKKKRGRPRKVEGKHSKDEDQQKEYRKEYYKNNKGKLLQLLTEKVKCEHCKKDVSKCNLLRHYDSSKCKKARSNNLVDKYIKDQKELDKLVETFRKLKKKLITDKKLGLDTTDVEEKLKDTYTKLKQF